MARPIFPPCLQNYPTMVAQALYAAFCYCFPHSYQQFNEEFKEALIALVFDWLVGVRPSKRSFLRWNMERLEPNTIKRHEDTAISQTKNNSKKPNLKLDSSDFDALEAMLSPTQDHTTQSMSSLNSIQTKPGKHLSSFRVTQKVVQVQVNPHRKDNNGAIQV